VKRAALSHFVCPVCRGQLTLAEASARQERVEEGELRCPACATSYPIARGLPNLLPRQAGGYDKAAEMEGWVSLWQKKGHYERPDYESSFRLPYIGGVWEQVAAVFDTALAELDLRGGEAVLDLAAGQGWASRHFAAKGCTVYAVDIVADELYGLGRAWAIMEHAAVYFEPLLGDGEALPFPDRSFDVVFICSGLHHFRRFGPVLREIRRVLKPGGRFMAAGEPAIPLMQRERPTVAAMEETSEGIVERRPKAFDYWAALRAAGFVDVEVDTLETHRMPPAARRQRLRQARAQVRGAVRPLLRPVAWIALSGALALPWRIGHLMLLTAQGGNLLVRARKPRP
jgi:SAM-dependent methyltransferase/uncharacterized protein YbaR (Trm112 family)